MTVEIIVTNRTVLYTTAQPCSTNVWVATVLTQVDVVMASETAWTIRTKRTVRHAIRTAPIVCQTSSHATIHCACTPNISVMAVRIQEIVCDQTSVCNKNKFFFSFPDNDCGDNSDEALGLCLFYNCTEENHRYRCKNGNCISRSQICNGKLFWIEAMSEYRSLWFGLFRINASSVHKNLK